MKISLPLSSFGKSVKVAAKISVEKSPSPILSNLRLTATPGSLVITATDLTTDLTITLPAEVEEPGRVVVPAKQLSDWLEKVSGGETVKATLKEYKLKLTCGRSTLTLSTIPPADFPDVDCITVFDIASVPKDEFFESIERTIHAVASDPNLIMSNLCLNFTNPERLEVVGCDGVRIAKYTLPCEIKKPISYILNEKSCRLLLEALKIETGTLSLRGCGNKFLVTGSQTQLAILRSEGEYVDYKQIIDNLVEKSHLTVDAEELKQSAKIVAVSSSDDNRFVDLTSSANLLNIRTSSRIVANSISESDSNVEITDSEGTIAITLNSTYLLESLSAIKSLSVYASICQLGTAPMFLLLEKVDGSVSEKIRCILAPYAVPE
jgi:DNA polymerase III subunit beta